MRSLINFACFYAGWVICVGTTNWIGPASVAVLVAAQMPFARNARREAVVLASAFALGTVTDTVFEQGGLVTYAGGPRIGPLCPLWISALWVLFASTLDASLAWLRGRPALTFVLSAVSGPFTYRIAAGMDAVTLELVGYVALGLEFGIYTVLLFVIQGKASAATATAGA